MSLGISTRRFLRVSLTSVRSVFIWTSSQRRSPAAARRSDLAVHLRAPRYGGHSFACQCSHSEAPTFALHASVGNARERTGSEGVRKGGVEPPKPFGYRILSPARLPVPPLSRATPARDAAGRVRQLLRVARHRDGRGNPPSLLMRNVADEIFLDCPPARGHAVHGPSSRHPMGPQTDLFGVSIAIIERRDGVSSRIAQEHLASTGRQLDDDFLQAHLVLRLEPR